MRRWSSLLLGLLMVASWSSLVCGNLSRQYSERWYCELGSFPVVLLSRNDTTGEFTLVERLHPLTKNFSSLAGFRHLEEKDVSVSESNNLRSNWIPGLSVANGDDMMMEGYEYDSRSLMVEELGKNKSTNTSMFYARECSCFGSAYPTVYCPFAVETCLRPKRRNDYQVPACMNRTPGGNFGGGAFIVLMGLYVVVLIYLLWSSMASHVGGFLASRCTLRWNDKVVDRILEGNTRDIRQNIRRVFDERPEDIERMVIESIDEDPAGARPNLFPTSLVLRTKVYCTDKTLQSGGKEKKDDATNKEDDQEQTEQAANNDDNQCAICYAPLEEGDKVGRLSCRHDFHSACLKVWLQRRNVCPLCQTGDIAKLSYDDVETKEGVAEREDEDIDDQGDEEDDEDQHGDSSDDHEDSD